MNVYELIRRGSRLIVALSCFMVLAAPLSYGDTVTFNLTHADPPVLGLIGGSATFEVDGVTVTATAWGNTSGLGPNYLAPGRLIQGGAGLGVCNAAEALRCDSSVDNIGQNDFILFTFSEQVDPLSIRLTIVNHTDWDLAYRLGNLTDFDLTDLGFWSPDDLAAGGFAPWEFAPSGSPTWPITVNIGSLTSANALLVGANPRDDNDGFKISQLTIETVPEPTSLLLLGSVFAAMSVRSLYRKGRK